MKHYHVICQSVRGESHVQRRTPKEDAAAVIRMDDRVIGAVSDGHGDPRCMRSQVGAQMAVDIALELLRDWDAEDTLEGETLLDSHIASLARAIVDRWNQTVAAHFQENPLTEAELLNAGNLKESYIQGRRISHIYGATLIAFLRSKDYLLLLQKGDGHAVLIDRQGRIDDRVIPWDDRCYLNVTTSLCDMDASDTFTYCILRNGEVEDIAAVMLGSDGVEDSFSNPDLMGAYYGLLAVECIENGEEATNMAMLDDLAEMSKYGSKDDISVVGLIDPEIIPSLKPIFERMQKRGTLVLKLESSASRLASMSAAHARREQQLRAKRRLLEEYQRRSAEIIEKKNALDVEIEQCVVEENRLKHEVTEMEADFEAYNKKLETTRLEREQLLAEIEQLK